MDLKSHFMIYSHDQTKSQRAEQKIYEATYLGEGMEGKLRNILILGPKHLMALSKLVDDSECNKSIRSIMFNVK